MEPNQPHNIYGPEHHGRREKDLESQGFEIWDANLAGGPENPGALEDIIGDGIQEAIAAHGLIDLSTARTIARTLAHALNGEAPHLDRFARDEVADRIGIESEYFELLEVPNLPDVVRSWIDWLATFLLFRDHPGGPRPLALPIDAADIPSRLIRETHTVDEVELVLNRPAGLLADGQALMIERVQELVDLHDDSMRAFLSLPDTNAADITLPEQFKELFVGTFNDIDDAIYGLSDLRPWNTELREWAEARGLIDMVSIDMNEMEFWIKDMYDLIEFKGVLHAFNR